jgi:hypothetical protein
MTLNAWLPIGHMLPDGAKLRIALYEGPSWQIIETQGGGRALVVCDDLVTRWVAAGLVGNGMLSSFSFGDRSFWSMSCGPSLVLEPVAECKSPNTKSEALAFAIALKATREIDKEVPLQDALYIEKISRLLPTYTISARTDDHIILGYWLTGGATVSVKSFRRLNQMMSWMSASNLRSVIEIAGFEVKEVFQSDRLEKKYREHGRSDDGTQDSQPPLTLENGLKRIFELPGRPALESFFNEHIVDIIQDRARYQALGIGFPSAVVLHGPSGCGKTFAVERLVDFLGWPSFQVDSSSVGSPYIHETSKKIAEVFDKATENAPSILIIDEMEAFLADRSTGTGHHRVEEVAEFLRRIPEATKHQVLIVAMTNRLDMIDTAILRRGRFDHIIKIDYPSEEEVRSLLEKILIDMPKEKDVDPDPLAKRLAGRPLSDVAFVVREGARMAAHSGKSRVDQESLVAALASTPSRDYEGSSRRIGFS